MRTIHQGPRAPSPDSQAEYTQAIRPRYLPFFENALAFGGSPYTLLGALLPTEFLLLLTLLPQAFFDLLLPSAVAKIATS